MFHASFAVAEIAQLVELLLPKQVVVGSSPIFRFHRFAAPPVQRRIAGIRHVRPRGAFLRGLVRILVDFRLHLENVSTEVLG